MAAEHVLINPDWYQIPFFKKLMSQDCLEQKI
jgi:hypothetical protein